MANRPAQAIEDYEQAAAVAAELNDTATTVAVHSRLAVAQATARHLDDAEAILLHVLSLSQSDVAHRGMAYVNRAWIADERGDTSAAIEHGLAGLEILRSCDADQLWIIEAHLELTKAYTNHGDLQEARHHLDAVYEILASGFETFPVRISAALANGELLLAEGRHLKAMAAFQHVMLLQSAGTSPYRMADTADGMGKVLFEIGEYAPGRRRAHCRSCRTQPGRGTVRYRPHRLLRGQGQARIRTSGRGRPPARPGAVRAGRDRRPRRGRLACTAQPADALMLHTVMTSRSTTFNGAAPNGADGPELERREGDTRLHRRDRVADPFVPHPPRHSHPGPVTSSGSADRTCDGLARAARSMIAPQTSPLSNTPVCSGRDRPGPYRHLPAAGPSRPACPPPSRQAGRDTTTPERTARR